MAGALEAVLIDDDGDEARAFRPIWEDILRSVWLDVNLAIQENFDDLTIFERLRPHVAIIDNVLLTNRGEVENRGLQLIADLKRENPDTLFVLFTNKSFTIDSLGYRFPNPDLIVTKTPLPNKKYKAEISAQIADRISRLPISQVAFSNPSSISRSPISRIEIQSLIEQCALSFQSFRREFNSELQSVEQVDLTELSGGKSGANVFRCNIFKEEGQENSEFVFKYSDAESISREIDNYHQYVRLQIPHHIRVDLVGVGRLSEIGAAMYGFAFGSSKIVSSMTVEISKKNVGRINSFMESIMKRDAIGWYNFSGLNQSVEDYFNEGLEYSPEKDSRRLSGMRENILKFLPDMDCRVSDGEVEADGFRFKHVRAYIQKFRGQEIPQFVCHGDLNSNNIVVFEGGDQYSLIDFEYTGVDTVYKDFVSLECSLRLNYPLSVDPEELNKWLSYEEEFFDNFGISEKTRIPGVSREAEEFFGAIASIRKNMVEFLKSRGVCVDPQHYQLCIAFHLLKLCGLDCWEKTEFLRLFFSYVAVLSTLEDEAS